jgi:hypothetical protein
MGPKPEETMRSQSGHWLSRHFRVNLQQNPYHSGAGAVQRPAASRMALRLAARPLN